MRVRAKLVGCLVSLAFVIAGVPALAADEDDTLGDFEREIEDAQEDDRRSRSGSSSGTWWPWGRTDPGGGWSGRRPGSKRKRHRFADRRPGKPEYAVARLEGTFQWLDDADVEGYAIRGEAIYDMIGIGGELIDYHEGEPSQSLEFGTAELIIRAVPSELFRVNLALGVRHITGRNDYTGFTGGVSLGLYPFEWSGFEADLRWTSVGRETLGDYRGGMLLRVPDVPYLAIRGGYRSISFRGETLHGPEVGAVLTW